MTDSRPKQLPPYGLRLPPDLKARIQASADNATRSLHAEIIHTLEEAYPPPDSDIQEVLSKIVDIQSMVAIKPDAEDLENIAFELSELHGDVIDLGEKLRLAQKPRTPSSDD